MPPAAFCREYTIHWDSPPDACQQLASRPEEFLAETGAKASVEGKAEVGFASGAPALIETTEFLNEARSILLARYNELRSQALDAVLQRAGILRWFADHTGQAGTLPKVETPPRPALNQPFPATP